MSRKQIDINATSSYILLEMKSLKDYNLEKEIKSNIITMLCVTSINQTNINMKSELENLFNVFQKYRITCSLEEVGVFDFGPNEKELQGISKPLREIPEDVLLLMEFYEYGWSSWGTEEEVKYYLPRLLELFSEKLDALEHVFSLLKFKLNDALRPESKWPEQEKKALHSYFISLLRCKLTGDIGFLIEGLVVVGISAEEVLAILGESEPPNQKLCAEKILAHFNVASSATPADPVYLDTRVDEIQTICNWACEVTNTYR